MYKHIYIKSIFCADRPVILLARWEPRGLAPLVRRPFSLLMEPGMDPKWKNGADGALRPSDGSSVRRTEGGRKLRPAGLRPADGGPRPPDGIGRDGTSVPPPSGGPSFRPPDEFDSVRRAEYSVPCVSPADETKTKLANDGFRPRTNRGGRSGGRFVAGRRSASGDETPPPGADETRGTDESAPPRTAPEFVFL